MRRNREFIERLGELPADLQTKHDRHMPVTKRDPRMSQGRGAPGVRMLRPGDPPMATTVRLVSWHFATVAASKQFLSANEIRRYLLTQNNSGADLWMNFSTAAAVGFGIKLLDGWSAEWYTVIPGNDLHFFSTVAGGSFTVLEG